jgi:hypothetical protein
MKIVQTNSNGSTTLIDLRVFSLVKENQLNAVKSRAMELILEGAPEYKQRNAALGLLSDAEANAIRAHIQSIRTISNQKEVQIEAITWNGDPATRAAACDAIEQIYWD